MFHMGRLTGGAGAAAAAVLAASILPTSDSNAASGYAVLHNFNRGNGGNEPAAGVIVDEAGNLYGTTELGGRGNDGTVFVLPPRGRIKFLHVFSGGFSDGAYPKSGVIMDPAGNLYGTTAGGGSAAQGTVYKIDTLRRETLLYSFKGGSDGANPYGGLVMDSAGNLYGTTVTGGSKSSGTVFRLAPNGSETVLYTFSGGSDGAAPMADLAIEGSGNLYGMTFSGGAGNDGTIFEIAPNGAETVLYAFKGGSDGAEPASGRLIGDQAGNLYGMTYAGGASEEGTVFKLMPGGQETVLYTFSGGSDGGGPFAGLFADQAGNFYGTTSGGGAHSAGVVFQLAPSGTETVLHAFSGGRDGSLPGCTLAADPSGNLYGTTTGGGKGSVGTIFRIKE